MYEVKEFSSRPRIITESPQKAGTHRVGVLLLNASHHHAKMLSFCNNSHSVTAYQFLDRRGDLVRHPFLHLKSPGVNLDYAGQLGYAYDLALW